MAVNVKLGNNTINGVNVVKLQDAESPTTYHSFGLAPSGMYKIEFVSEGSTIGYVEVVQGESLKDNPYVVSKANYTFMGWSTTQGGTTAVVFPYTPAANGMLYAIWAIAPKCVVNGLGSSSPSSVTFTKDANFNLSTLGIEEVIFNGDTFIKIPTMYRKVNTVSNGQITSFAISSGKIENDYQPYSCFLDESGNLLDYVLIGKYWNTNASSCVSTSQGNPSSMNLANGRTYAKNRGTGYQLFDWQIQKLWQDLIICFKETINTNSGSGIGTNGYDNLGIYWSGSAGLIDGVIGSSGTWRLCYKPSKYASLSETSDPIPADYVSAGYSQATSINEIQKLGYDSSNPFFNYPNAITSNNNYNTYYCDHYSYSSGNRPIISAVGGGSSDYGAFNCGMFNISWSTTYAVRLCYRPISS